jgi:hypothetical protein
MPGKDDLFANRTLWLDREGMEVARERFWQAYRQSRPETVRTGDDHHIWEVAFAAAVAAHSFIWEGNFGPKPE